MQYSDFLITNSIGKYADNLYTMLGYPVQTGDSGEEEGEEALPKGATKTKLKRNRMEQPTMMTWMTTVNTYLDMKLCKLM